ncbi:hypothetical protein ACT453_21280 [Bacillus sp. D-CC]
MFWYGDFKATPHTTVQKSGGKGGGTKTSNTTFSYSASLMLGLCENQIKKIGLIWVDKEQFVPKQEGTITLDPIDQLIRVSVVLIVVLPNNPPIYLSLFIRKNPAIRRAKLPFVPSCIITP